MRMMVPTDSTGVLGGRVLNGLGGEVEALFNAFFGEDRDRSGEGAAMTYRPAMDVEETEDAYHLWFDLPGVAFDDLKIEFDEEVLTVGGVRRRDESSVEGRRHERVMGEIQRTLRFPEAINADSIDAHYTDGVLSVVVPKAAKPEARKIEIRRGGSVVQGGTAQNKTTQDDTTQDDNTPG